MMKHKVILLTALLASSLIIGILLYVQYLPQQSEVAEPPFERIPATTF